MKVRALTAIFVACFGFGCVPTAYAAEVTLTAASFQPAGVVFARHFFHWVGATNDRCAGKVSIEIVEPSKFPSHEQWHALKVGDVDMYFGPANYYRGAMPEGDVLSLAQNELTEQRGNGAWALLNALHNERVNAWYLTSLLVGVKFHLYTTKPANGARFDGLRLRSVPLFDGFLRSLGASTQELAAPSLRAALEEGTVDGFGWPLWGIDTLGWDKVTTFRYGPGFLNAAAPVLINLDTWQSLADDQRDCLTEMAVWLEAQWPEWRAEEDARQLAALEEAGIKYMDLGPEFVRKAEDPYWAQIEKAAPGFVHGIRPLLTAAD